MKRTIKKQFWFSRDEAQDLQKKAKKTCLSEAALVRLLLRGYEPKEKPDDRFYDAMREFSAIGNNIHQISVKANALGFIDTQKLNSELDRLHKFQADMERYYCYRLGYLPKYKAGQQNHARVHYLFKEDLMKIDELTKQVTLLGKHHIGTDEQLFSYQHSVEEQVKTLTADRTHLRNEIRKVNITDAELSQAKASISLLTEKLKELRKEVKLCQDIAVRSKVIEEKVDAVRAEEEKSKRKENRNYEQRR